MALGLVLVNSTNELIETVKIDFQSHGELFDCMPVDKYPLLERIRDYYTDAEYHPSELNNVVIELSGMLDSLSEDKNTRLLQSMISLVEKALALDCKVEAIADQLMFQRTHSLISTLVQPTNQTIRGQEACKGSLQRKLTNDDMQKLANSPDATRVIDNRSGNLNVIQEVDGITLRITVPKDAMKIISVGPIRPN